VVGTSARGKGGEKESPGRAHGLLGPGCANEGTHLALDFSL